MNTVYIVNEVQGDTLILKRAKASNIIAEATGASSLSRILGVKSKFNKPLIVISDKKMKLIKRFVLLGNNNGGKSE